MQSPEVPVTFAEAQAPQAIATWQPGVHLQLGITNWMMSMDFVVRISASSILDIGAFNSLLVFVFFKLCICTPACKHKIIVQHLYIDVLHDFSIPMKLHSNLSIWAWLSCNKNTSTSDTRCQNMYLVHPYSSLPFSMKNWPWAKGLYLVCDHSHIL